MGDYVKEACSQRAVQSQGAKIKVVYFWKQENIGFAVAIVVVSVIGKPRKVLIAHPCWVGLEMSSVECGVPSVGFRVASVE